MITADRMAVIDRNAAALGISQEQLMESSGHAVARVVRSHVPDGGEIAIVAGRGNNGGDAFVTARFLDAYNVTIHLIGRPESIRTDIARSNWKALVSSEYQTSIIRDSRDIAIGTPDLIVDGLLGTGISGPPREPEASAISRINDVSCQIVSIDVPSGLDADTGEAPGAVVDADQVVTFHDMKPGLADWDGVTVADIGIPKQAELFVGPGELMCIDRDPESHKGDNGRILIVGGGPYTGAPALTGLAALRAGADLCYIHAPASVAREIQGFGADLIVNSYPGERLGPEHVDDILEAGQERDVIVLGPGLGDNETTREAVRQILRRYSGRGVVDADAVSTVPSVETDADLICTPHQGELDDMGGPVGNQWRDQLPELSEFAGTIDQTILLKGVYDLIADGDNSRVNRTGNAGMTVGGTGDVLAGVVAAMFVSLESLTAASVGAYVTGAAGDLAFESKGTGLLASDLLETLPEAIQHD